MTQTITASTDIMEWSSEEVWKQSNNAIATLILYLFFLFLVLLMANKTRRDRRMKWDEKEENTNFQVC